ncbi:MAG: MBL fold metallo-hydrolase, partial [Candidatus Micrarchaeota archaeon]
KSVLRAGATRIALDCKPPRERNATNQSDSSCDAVFVSHAHYDHAPALRDASRLITSDATRELLVARGLKIDSAANAISPKLPDELALTLLPSGHVLGGSMLYAEWDSTSFLYTGDFKPSQSLTQKVAAQPSEVETLVIESTYGAPGLRFPPRNDVYKKIAAWATRETRFGACVLAGYALGKAQELVACLNEYAGTAPIVTPDIAALCEIYAKHGVKLDYVSSASPEGCAELRKRFVAVLAPSVARRFTPPSGQRLATAYASGWCATCFEGAGGAGGGASGNAFGFDAGFALSDHADFFELVNFVEQCAPKRVLCVHGFSEQLAAALRRRGFDATAAREARRAGKPAAEKKQRTLIDCARVEQ